MSRRFASYRRLFSAFVLVAFVHQLGGCPCGEMDHYHWRQAWNVSNGSTHSHTHLPSEHQSESIAAAHDCNCSASPCYRSNNRQLLLEEIATEIATTNERISYASFLAANPSTSSRFNPNDCASNIALAVRAELQIFLL